MDEFYKIVFAFPRMVRDLVRGFLPERWTADLDLDKLRLLPAAYVGDGWQTRYGDRVWKIPYKERSGHPPGAYAVLLLEFQSTVDNTMAVRMLVYAGLLFQEILRGGAGLGPGGKLPLAIPVVIHNGRQRWSAPLSVSEMAIAGVPDLNDFQPQLAYWPLDEWRLASEDLPKDNLMSSLVALETGDGEALDQAVAALATLLADPIDQQIRRAFRDWIHRLKSPQVLQSGRTLATLLMEEPMTLLERVNEKLERWYDELERQANERGMAEGRQVVLAEERALLGRMAERRFGTAVAALVAARLKDTDDSDGFAAIGDAIVDCTTGNELLTRLRNNQAL